MADDLTITRVKEASDLADVIGEYLSLTKKGRTFKALCPFHDDHNPSLDVDPVRQRYTCWACGKQGDVFTFIMEKEKVTFPEALEQLAKRANIELKPGSRAAHESKSKLLEIMAWAAERFHQNLFAADSAAARDYLDQRKLNAETIKAYQLGFAPPGWEWLAKEAARAKINPRDLDKLGLCGLRPSDGSLFDNFRDRIIFPIRDARGRTIAFGGRILPGSAQAGDGPKYYNSRESSLFIKSQHFYGLDRARSAAEKEGFLAIVEGYTDVLMAHQSGVLPVAATLGTALNGQHLENLSKFSRRVVLIYDADAGGRSGIDRALQLFIQNEIDLAIALLPEGQDPCDYLLEAGPEPFRARLKGAKDALEFVLERATTPERMATVPGRQQALEEVLKLIALIPPGSRTSLEVKKQLAMSRLAQQFNAEERTLWQRLAELTRRPNPRAEGGRTEAERPAPAPADGLEKEFIGVLLADPQALDEVRDQVSADELSHPGIRAVFDLMLRLAAEGRGASYDLVRQELAERPKLAAAAAAAYEESIAMGNLAARRQDVVSEFVQRRLMARWLELRTDLRTLQPGDPRLTDVNEEMTSVWRKTARLRELRAEIRQLQPGDPRLEELNHELRTLWGPR